MLALVIVGYLAIGAAVAFSVRRFFGAEEFDGVMCGTFWPLGCVVVPILAIYHLMEYAGRAGARRP